MTLISILFGKGEGSIKKSSFFGYSLLYSLHVEEGPLWFPRKLGDKAQVETCGR